MSHVLRSTLPRSTHTQGAHSFPASSIPILSLGPSHQALHLTLPRCIGANVPPNRHDLQASYLLQLDRLVVLEIRRQLSTVNSVSVLSDGWRDRVRRNWLDLGIAWVSDLHPTRWVIETVDADLIPIVGASTGNTIETLVRESVEEFVRLFFMLTSSLFLPETLSLNGYSMPIRSDWVKFSIVQVHDLSGDHVSI